MKKFLALFLALTLAVLTLASCQKGNKFTSDGISFVDKKTDVSYDFAPLCYEPIAIGEEVYGSDGDIEFHEIVGKDPTKWLCDADGGVFYAKGTTLPTVDKMNISRLELCTAKDQILVAKKITDTDKISQIVGGYLTEAEIVYPNKAASLSYKLRFADTDIGVFYCIDFIRYEEDLIVIRNGEEISLGNSFLYNRSEDRFVKAPEALIAEVNALAGYDGQ
jgi:hypothetical protein